MCSSDKIRTWKIKRKMVISQSISYLCSVSSQQSRAKIVHRDVGVRQGGKGYETQSLSVWGLQTSIICTGAQQILRLTNTELNGLVAPIVQHQFGIQEIPEAHPQKQDRHSEAYINLRHHIGKITILSVTIVRGLKTGRRWVWGKALEPVLRHSETGNIRKLN